MAKFQLNQGATIATDDTSYIGFTLGGGLIGLTDTTGGSPASRLWEIISWPGILTNPPSLSSTTGISVTFDGSAADGCYICKLTRVDSGVTTTRILVVGIQDINGLVLPSPGLTGTMLNVGANPTEQGKAQKVGWAGGLYGATNTLVDAYMRFCKGIVPPTANTPVRRDATGGIKASFLDSGAASDLTLLRNAVPIMSINAAGWLLDQAVASPVLGQAQRTTGAGQAMVFRAQKGQAGQLGGSLTIGGGHGGTPGTNLSGNTVIDLGQVVSNASARMQLFSASFNAFNEWGVDSGGVFEVSSSHDIRVWDYVADCTYKFNSEGNTYVAFNGPGGMLECNLSIYLWGSGFAPTITQQIVAGTGGGVGQLFKIQAQQGRAVAGGTNNDGGVMAIRSGNVGTGGSNGAHGAIQLGLGNSENTVRILDAGAAVRTIELVTGMAFTLRPALSGGATNAFTILGQQTTSGAGGALALAGGAGTTSAGAASLTGGAASAGGGGAASVVGGTGTSTAGAASLIGGAGVTNGNGGDAIVKAGALAGAGAEGSCRIQTAGGTNRIQTNATGIGFFGVAPVARSATYTVTNPTTDRALNVTTDTLVLGLQVLGTLILDLQLIGIIG